MSISLTPAPHKQDVTDAHVLASAYQEFKRKIQTDQIEKHGDNEGLIVDPSSQRAIDSGEAMEAKGTEGPEATVLTVEALATPNKLLVLPPGITPTPLSSEAKLDGGPFFSDPLASGGVDHRTSMGQTPFEQDEDARSHVSRRSHKSHLRQQTSHPISVEPNASQQLGDLESPRGGHGGEEEGRGHAAMGQAVFTQSERNCITSLGLR